MVSHTDTDASAQLSSGAAAAATAAVVVAVVAVVAVLLLLPLLSKVGTLGKNIINTFDLLTGEWLWWKLHWNCAREQAEPEEKRRSRERTIKKSNQSNHTLWLNTGARISTL